MRTILCGILKHLELATSRSYPASARVGRSTVRTQAGHQQHSDEITEPELRLQLHPCAQQLHTVFQQGRRTVVDARGAVPTKTVCATNVSVSVDTSATGIMYMRWCWQQTQCPSQARLHLINLPGGGVWLYRRGEPGREHCRWHRAPFHAAGYRGPPCMEANGEQERPILRTKDPKPSARRPRWQHHTSQCHMSGVVRSCLPREQA